MLTGLSRLLGSALQVSPVGLVHRDHVLLRVGCRSEKEVFQLICRSAVQHCLTEYCGAATPASAIAGFAEWHSKNNHVGVPRWAEASREAIILDVFRCLEEQQATESRNPSHTESRCNAAILLHDTEGLDALDELRTLSEGVLPFLSARRIPTVLAGAVDAETLSQGGTFAAMSLYGRWQNRYAKVAARHFGHVYSAHFFCPSDPQSCFDLLYRAQMSVLYPLGRCFSAGAEGIIPTSDFLTASRVIFQECDVDDDGVWAEGDWGVFWDVVHSRPPSDYEADQLRQARLFGASHMNLVQWFLELSAQGRGDVLWACLRAFGFDGSLRRHAMHRSR